MSKKTLYVDADSLLYLTIFAAEYNTGLDGEDLNKPSMKILKKQFKSKLQEVIDSCELDSAIGSMVKFKDFKCVFTGKTNFRYDIFPNYKWQRTVKEKTNPKPPEFYKLKKWAIKKFGIISELVEADDIVSYYGKKGHPIASADKDVLKNTAGIHYDMYHRNFAITTKESAAEFLAIQCINGDITADDIPGIRIPKAKKYKGDKTKAPKNGPITKTNPNGVGLNRVGETTAKKLLAGDFSFENILKIYKDHGFSKEYAITQIRLVHMHQIKKIKKNGEIILELIKL